MPQSMAIRVEPPAMRMEFSMYFAMGARDQISAKFIHMYLRGNTVPFMLKISSRLFRAVVNMTK